METKVAKVIDVGIIPLENIKTKETDGKVFYLASQVFEKLDFILRGRKSLIDDFSISEEWILDAKEPCSVKKWTYISTEAVVKIVLLTKPLKKNMILIKIKNDLVDFITSV